MSDISVGRRLVFAIVAAVLVLVAFEGALKIVGFKYKRSLSYMQFNFPGPNSLHNIYRPDPGLLWTMRPGYDFGQGFPPLNQQGFRGREFEKEKKPGVFRIACMGCSVTFGQPDASYPDLLEKELAKRLGRPIEAMNFGVPGYSSWQGKKMLDMVLPQYQPDMVIVFFGWNDHWLAKGFPDKEQIVNMPVAQKVDPIKNMRIYQLLNKIIDLIRARGKQLPLVLRVAPEDYKANLEAMIETVRKSGAKVVMTTAPSAISTGAMPDFLIPKEFIRQPEDLARLHDQYNGIARQVAKSENVPLADLDLIFKNQDVTSLFNDPNQDLVHPNAKGLQIIANALAEVIQDQQ